jgi:hypothetical protein
MMNTYKNIEPFLLGGVSACNGKNENNIGNLYFIYFENISNL